MWPLSCADGAEIPEPPCLAPSSLTEPGIGLGPAEPGVGWGVLWAGSPRDGRTRQRAEAVAGGCLPGLYPPPPPPRHWALSCPHLPSVGGSIEHCHLVGCWACSDTWGLCWHTAPRPGMTFVCGGP